MSLCLLGGWDAEETFVKPTVNLRKYKRNHREKKEILNLFSKASTLKDGTAQDKCGWSESRQSSNIDLVNIALGKNIYKASTPSGTCTLFKTLYTNTCNSDCSYCINSTHNKEEHRYTPYELANIFNKLYTGNIVQGLFLSSAMGNNSEKTMDDMIFTVEILRLKYAFKGYVHLKILPGSSRYQVKRAVELANRVSLNIEEPNSSRLSEVCSVKDFNVDILKRQSWVRDLSFNLSSGQSTQLIIGATEETDEEIFHRIHHLYSEMKMRRIYYSAFKPIPNTRLQSKSAIPSWRESRLYQIDWLYRIYKYKVKEIHDVLIDGFLQNVDPKIVLANLQLKKPIEVNDAPQDELLRIPGIGPRSARKIIQKRRNKEIIKSRKQLVEMGVVISRAQPYLKIDGSQQSTLKKWF